MTHALHNLCASNITLPPGTSRLLSLGLNFCIKTPYPNINFKAMIDQFTHDVRNLNFWLNEHEDDGRQRTISLNFTSKATNGIHHSHQPKQKQQSNDLQEHYVVNIKYIIINGQDQT